MVCAFGTAEQSCLMAAMKKGGHPRTGFETSPYKGDGSIASDHIDKVYRLQGLTTETGLIYASPQQVRDALLIR